MTIGTGIGVGLVLNGHVYHGSHRASGEVGYWLLGSLGPIERRDTQFGPLGIPSFGNGDCRSGPARLRGSQHSNQLARSGGRRSEQNHRSPGIPRRQGGR